MNKKQSGFSMIGLLIVLLLTGFLAYQYLQPQSGQAEKKSTPQAPKSQKQVNDLKNKMNQQVEQQQNEKDKAWEDL